MNIHQVKITDILRTIKTVWDFNFSLNLHFMKYQQALPTGNK